MKYIRRKIVSNKIKSENTEEDRLIIEREKQLLYEMLKGNLHEARRHLDDISLIISRQTIPYNVSRWYIFVHLCGKLIYSLHMSQLDKANQAMYEIQHFAYRLLQDMISLIYQSCRVAVLCKSGMYEYAVSRAKRLSEDIRGVNTAKISQNIVVVSSIFYNIFEIMSQTLIPAEIQGIIHNFYRSRAKLHGTKLGMKIYKCIGNYAYSKKNLKTYEANLRKSLSGSASKGQMVKKSRTRYHDRSQPDKIHYTFRYPEDQGTPVKYGRKEIMEIYTGEKKSRKKVKPHKREDVPEEMRNLEQIKKMYQPKAVQRIHYTYEPGLLYHTQKLEFLMVPIDKSVYIDTSSIHKEKNVHSRNLTHILNEKQIKDIKHLKSMKNSVVQQNLRKTHRTRLKRFAQTPTLVTHSSIEDTEISVRNPYTAHLQSSRRVGPHDCSLI